MKIQLLNFDGCPSWENGLKNLEVALLEEDLSASIEMVKVTDDDEAVRLKFLGSPHFRVNRHDLWPENRETYSLSCRAYPTSDGIKGFPTVAMLRQQLKQFKEV